MSADVQDFDLDAWIDDASLPETAVTVVGKGKLKAEHDELVKRLQQAQSTYSGDARLVDPTVELANRIRDISEEMRASELTFRFRALTGPEAKVVRAEALEMGPKGDDGEPGAEYMAAAWLAASSVYPKMTAEQVNRIRARIGEGQFFELWSEAFGVSNRRHVDIPFWPAASAILSNQES